MELQEGQSLAIHVKPLGTTMNLENSFATSPDREKFNEWYYRVPDVVELSVLLGVDMLARQRISLYQSGAVLAAPLNW